MLILRLNEEWVKVTGIEAVRRYFPDATDEQAEFILWNKTGFPAFLERGVGSLLNQIKRLKIALSWHLDCCYGCGNIQKTDGMLCYLCRERHKELK